MKQVLVLGGTGMLGTAMSHTLTEAGFDVTVTHRRKGNEKAYPYRTVYFDVRTDDIGELMKTLPRGIPVVNAIGVIKPHINEGLSASVDNAIRVNSMFPHELAAAAESNDSFVIQIATDCVFSGRRGAYLESDPHDPLDVYGKTKSLGESPADNILHLRASIIGPEEGRSTSLLAWVLSQPKGAALQGYANHRWNGVTTRTFSRICAGLLSAGVPSSGLIHVVPGDSVTKSQLLSMIAGVFSRTDLSINDVDAPEQVDRTLATDDPSTNDYLWSSAGYEGPPTVSEMIVEARAWLGTRP